MILKKLEDIPIAYKLSLAAILLALIILHFILNIVGLMNTFFFILFMVTVLLLTHVGIMLSHEKI